MITRKLGALLRGKATPFQIVTACVLGAMLGFAPDVYRAPGLYALLVAALLVINANLGLALLVIGVTKVLSWLLASTSFRVGQFLLDGPASDLARSVVNAPVFAWCGLSYYAVAGGLVIGATLGLVLGLVLAGSVRAFQRRMQAAAGNPSRLNEIAGKGWAKALTWVFFGGRGKGTWDDILAKRVGNPVRVLGVVVVAILGVGLWLGQRSITKLWAASALEDRLALVNGATANVGEVELDFRNGSFGVRSLALADPEALQRDLFRADELAADFDQVDILRRRVHMAKLVVSGAESGVARAEPGRRTVPPVDPPTTGDPKPGGDDGIWQLDEVLQEAQIWKDRLAQAKRVLERVSGKDARPSEDEGFADRAARRAREAGWFQIEASHLVDKAPSFLLSELTIGGLAATWLPGRVLDVQGANLSTHPWLLDASPKLSLTSRDGAIGFDVDLASASRKGGEGRLQMHWKGLAVDDVLGQLKLRGDSPLRGGTLDLALDGGWAQGEVGNVNLPLRVTFRGTTFQMKGVAPTTIDEFTLPIGLSGPLDALKVHFEGERLAKALADAGKAELAGRLRSELTKQLEGPIGEKLQGLTDKAGIKLPGDLEKGVEEGAKDLLKGVLGGKKPKK